MMHTDNGESGDVLLSTVGINPINTGGTAMRFNYGKIFLLGFGFLGSVSSGRFTMPLCRLLFSQSLSGFRRYGWFLHDVG